MKKGSLSTFELFKHLDSEKTVTVSDADLKKMQADLLTMLKDIISVCDDNDFYYTLGGGSVLGAIRHQGFIPWDDDIDVNMKRKDLLPFVNKMRERFSDRYWVRTPWDTENYGLLMVQIRKKGTSVRTRDDYWNDECGLCIDVFPLENTFDNSFLRLIHKIGCYYYGFAVSCRKFYRDREWLMSLSDDKVTEKVFARKIRIGHLLSWRSIDQWVKKADKWYSLCKDEESKMIVIPTGRRHFRELYERNEMCQNVLKPFCDLQASCPKGYDMYLKRLYGDYMKLPKQSDIEQHKYFAPFNI